MWLGLESQKYWGLGTRTSVAIRRTESDTEANFGRDSDPRYGTWEIMREQLSEYNCTRRIPSKAPQSGRWS